MTRLLRSDYKDHIIANKYSDESLNIVYSIRIMQGASNTTIQHLLRNFRAFHWCSAQSAYLVDQEALAAFLVKLFQLADEADTSITIEKQRVISALCDILW